MPSSPKIPKELILQNALEFVRENGYDRLTIKALAAWIGCSTQPISWHFKNMEGLRSSLAEYMLAYAAEKLDVSSKESLSAFEASGTAYLKMAVEEPNLFRFLYLNGYQGNCAGNFHMLTHDAMHREIISAVATRYNIEETDAEEYVRNAMIYTHGVATLIATGVISADFPEAVTLVKQASDAYLQSTIRKAQNNSPSGDTMMARKTGHD